MWTLRQTTLGWKTKTHDPPSQSRNRHEYSSRIGGSKNGTEGRELFQLLEATIISRRQPTKKGQEWEQKEKREVVRAIRHSTQWKSGRREPYVGLIKPPHTKYGEVSGTGTESVVRGCCATDGPKDKLVLVDITEHEKMKGQGK